MKVSVFLQAPSKSSPFVAAVTKPVRAFLEDHQHLLGTDEKRRTLASLILSEILQRCVTQVYSTNM